MMKLKAVNKEQKKDTRELLDRFTPINDLISKANTIQEKCHDFMVSNVSHDNMVWSDGNLRFIPNNCSKKVLPMSKYALSQLCTKIGVPASYLQSCIDTGRIELAANNINEWLSYLGKDLFIREYDGRIRGVLSNKYSICDTPDILDVLQNTVNLNDYDVKGSFLNEERLHLRLIGKEMLPIHDEDLFHGLFIDSSDVGRNVLTVQFGLYKLVCTNGLVMSKYGGTLFQQKHIGIKSKDFYEGLVASLKNVDSLRANTIEMVELARSNDTRYQINRMSPDEFSMFLAHIRGVTKLSNEGAKKVIDLMQNKYDDTKWGYINSLTEVAQDYTLERRLEIERIAGNLLVA